MGTARACDETSLAAYCESVARFRVASDLVSQTGLMIRDRQTGDWRKNPAVAQARDASFELRTWAREFGFTPSARQPLRVEHSYTSAPAERLLS